MDKIGIGFIGARFAADLHAHALSKIRGGKCEIVEGHGVARNVVLEFPSFEHAIGYARSPEYAEAKALRQGAGTIDITVVEGV